MNFRLLQTGRLPARENMAIDEAVLNNIADGKSPATIRFYGWQPSAISIGYFQCTEEEVDLSACAKLGIDYVRRITGGGAVFHQEELTYSVHIPESANFAPNGILESYKFICGGIINGLKNFGITAQFVPLNDIIVHINNMPKKISGNAQTRKRGIILQHGTILLKVDVDKMFSILKVPSEKLKGKLIEDVKQRVTGLSDALKRDVSFEEAEQVFIKGFLKAFTGAQFTKGVLTQNEKFQAEKLATEKYGTDEWNKKR